MFYKATVQSVLLFGSETWCLTPATLQRLEGFHVRAARRMTGRMPVLANGVWVYPKTEEVLAAAGLRSIEYYVRIRRARILKWVEARPIYRLCRAAVRKRGTPPRTFWWEQPMNMELAPMHLEEATGVRALVLADEGEGGVGGRRNQVTRRGPPTR